MREDLYSSETALEGIPPLPYRERFQQLADAQKTGLCPPTVAESTCPFYRSRIRHFARVSPLLMGLMTATARAALAPDFHPWLTRREGSVPAGLVTAIENLTARAGARCAELQAGTPVGAGPQLA